MGEAKQIIVKPISASDANRLIMALHYSHKVVNNSQLHLGIFLGERCGGAMQFGPSLDKRKIIGLVKGTLWNEFLELNRLAFADWLPRNSESRALGFAMRWIRKTYPWIKWVVSFADGTQCGDGTIYRASGFVLTGIQNNATLYQFPDGTIASNLALKTGAALQRRILGSVFYGEKGLQVAKTFQARKMLGFQLRYLYFLDPTARDRLTVPILPFSEIERRGAGMYRGKPRSGDQAAPAAPPQAGGSTPTSPLQSSGGDV